MAGHFTDPPAAGSQHYRDVREWTLRKLAFLADYLRQYAAATKRIRKHGGPVCYVDLFSGPGWDRDRTSGEVHPGSPVLAMNLYPSFTRFVFVDSDAGNVAAVRGISSQAVPSQAARVLLGDCNEIVLDALRSVPQSGAAFAFLDPAGVDLHWATISAIARHKQDRRKIEQFILFPYNMALVRCLTRDRAPGDVWGPAMEDTIDRVLPNGFDWRAVVRQRDANVIGPAEARRRFAYAYWQGLRDLGYRYVVSPRLMTRDNGTPLYFLFFASDHEAGERIMAHVLHRQPRLGEQMPLPLQEPFSFDPDEDWYVRMKSIQ